MVCPPARMGMHLSPLVSDSSTVRVAAQHAFCLPSLQSHAIHTKPVNFARVSPSAGLHPRLASYACSSILGGPAVCIPCLTLATAFRDRYVCGTLPTILRRGPLLFSPRSA